MFFATFNVVERDNGHKIRKMVLQDPSSQLAPKDLILMERRNQKQVGDDNRSWSLAGWESLQVYTKGDVESRTEYLLFYCEPLAQIRFTE